MELIQTKKQLVLNQVKKRLEELNKKVSSSVIQESIILEKVSSSVIQESIIFLDYHINGKSPDVNKVISIDKVFDIIKNGNGNINLINKARTAGKYTKEYDNIKMNLLPSVRFNFNFDGRVSNKNIKAATGLIYLDVDDVYTLDNTNNLIFASWKSLSSTGYGLLVKIDGLTNDNFSTNYLELSKILGFASDNGAKKGTQQTILSYDNNIYINNDSLVFNSVDNVVIEKASAATKGKRERLITVDDTFAKSEKLRFNNISDYFTGENKDKEFLVFDEKESLCIPFIPTNIPLGKRNVILYFVLSQYALLNINCGAKFILECARTINTKFVECYSDDKIKSIVSAILTKREKNELELYFNKERRIIFNPNKKITKEQKQKIVGQQMGIIKTDKTQNEIYSIVENWDFQINGEINQNKVAAVSTKSIATIKRNWSIVKDLAKQMNKDFNNGITDYISTKPNTDILSIENKEVIVDVVEDDNNTPNWTIAPEYNYNEVERVEYIPNQFIINEVDKLEIPKWNIPDEYVKPDWCN